MKTARHSFVDGFYSGSLFVALSFVIGILIRNLVSVRDALIRESGMGYSALVIVLVLIAVWFHLLYKAHRRLRTGL